VALARGALRDTLLEVRPHTSMSDIRFQCPSCTGSLNVPQKMANQLMECPSCRQTIEVPVRSRSQTSDSGNFAVEASGDESVFFRSGGILVTNARFVVGAKTFAMRGITSVEAVESDSSELAEKQSGSAEGPFFTGTGLLIIAVGLVCWLMFDFSFFVAVGAGIIGFLMLIVGASFVKMKRAFKIVLKTAGGEVTAYQSFDRDHISQIIRALNDSIISHG
jgi:hypothetical protein